MWPFFEPIRFFLHNNRQQHSQEMEQCDVPLRGHARERTALNLVVKKSGAIASEETGVGHYFFRNKAGVKHPEVGASGAPCFVLTILLGHRAQPKPNGLWRSNMPMGRARASSVSPCVDRCRRRYRGRIGWARQLEAPEQFNRPNRND